MPVRNPRTDSNKKSGPEQAVERYFELIRDLRKGDEAAVDALMEMWAPDGVFEFAGAPPVVGTFKGAMAIRTLYHNRVQNCRMSVADDGARQDERLGVVDTQVLRIRRSGTKILAGWTTTVGTTRDRGFDMGGSHQFTFERGKIKKLRVLASGKATESGLERLSLEGLKVADIGRLSLAAWPVV
jgi:ketosteroid isomerase-like protein